MRTGGGGRLLRDNVRRRQNRDCHDLDETSGGTIHNLLQATICLRKRRLVISREHFGKTFHLHEPESAGERSPVCLRTMIGRVWDISSNRWQKDAYRSATIVELPISATVIGRGYEEALRSFLPADGLRIKFPRCASNRHK